jgi:hypothetical protein
MAAARQKNVAGIPVRASGAVEVTPAGPGSKSLGFEKAPSAPGAADLHWLAIVANRNCCSHRRNKQVVAVRTHNSGFHRVANGHARIGLLPASAC